MNTKGGLWGKKSFEVSISSWRVTCEEKPHSFKESDSRGTFGSVWAGCINMSHWLLFFVSALHQLTWLHSSGSLLKSVSKFLFLHFHPILSAPHNSQPMASPISLFKHSTSKKDNAHMVKKLVPRDRILVGVTLLLYYPVPGNELPIQQATRKERWLNLFWS